MSRGGAPGRAGTGSLRFLLAVVWLGGALVLGCAAPAPVIRSQRFEDRPPLALAQRAWTGMPTQTAGPFLVRSAHTGSTLYLYLATSDQLTADEVVGRRRPTLKVWLGAGEDRSRARGIELYPETTPDGMPAPGYDARPDLFAAPALFLTATTQGYLKTSVQFRDVVVTRTVGEEGAILCFAVPRVAISDRPFAAVTVGLEYLRPHSDRGGSGPGARKPKPRAPDPMTGAAQGPVGRMGGESLGEGRMPNELPSLKTLEETASKTGAFDDEDPPKPAEYWVRIALDRAEEAAPAKPATVAP